MLREYFFAPTNGTGDKVDGAGQALRNCILDFFFVYFSALLLTTTHLWGIASSYCRVAMRGRSERGKLFERFRTQRAVLFKKGKRCQRVVCCGFIHEREHAVATTVDAGGTRSKFFLVFWESKVERMYDV